MQLTQELKPVKHSQRRNIANWVSTQHKVEDALQEQKSYRIFVKSSIVDKFSVKTSI